MGRFQFAIAAALAFVTKHANAYTIGSPAGLAAGTTGGAGGEVVYPTSPSELIAYLNDTEPLCLAENNGFKSQDVIIQSGGMNNTGGCSNGTEVTLTYDNAALKRMNVKGNKTVRGIGKSGVIMGKGMTLNGDNIILQNIHITELNRHGSDKGNTTINNIWIDHVKVSHVGRQMLVTNKAGVATMTVSNSDFDGNTDYSATCDGHHYWTFLFYGKNTGVSMLNNYVHGTSGRSPKVGGTKNEHVVAHIANNYWGDNSGHSFEIGANAYVLTEGNYFNNTKQPLYKGKDGSMYTSNGTDATDACTSYLGRSCKANVLVGSGNFTSRDGSAALDTIKTYPVIVSYSNQAGNSEQQATQASDSEQQQPSSTHQALPNLRTKWLRLQFKRVSWLMRGLRRRTILALVSLT
ncbi:unnamed protein product [Phytophthora lilii]|uniref:pectin lyase n=1 Tax=Phytophthora lilii TaxID=2077276 RepID=A0A9W6WNN2_9STRA|nr:unnamed protein product [Phytophthora lilii]